MEYLIILVVSISAMSSAGTSAHFIYPPDASNLTFHYGDTVIVEWISTYLPTPGTGPYLWLKLFCGPKAIEPFSTNVTTNGTKPISFINLDFEGWNLPIECHFDLSFKNIKTFGSRFILGDQDPNLLPSTWVTTTAVTTTSTMSSSVTIAPTPASLFNISSIPAPTPAPSPATQIATISITTSQMTTATAPNLSRSSGLDSGARAGIGVSSTVGGLSLLAALAYLLVRSKKAGQVSSPESHPREDDRRINIVDTKAELSSEHTRYELPEGLGLLHELPGERQLHEFPDGQNSHELDGNEYSNGGSPAIHTTCDMPITA